VGRHWKHVANEDYISRVITHRLPVDRIDEAFELFFSDETGNVVSHR